MDDIKYPYQLKELFLINLSFKRKNEVGPIELPISSEMKLIEPGFPQVQINMRFSTPEDGPVIFSFEIVGLFDYVGESSRYDEDSIKEFLFDKALHMLWVYATQTVSLITGQMGMNPIKMKIPIDVPVYKIDNTPPNKE